MGVFWSKKWTPTQKPKWLKVFSLHLKFCLSHFKATVLAYPKVSAETLSVCISLDRLSSKCSFNRSEKLSAQFLFASLILDRRFEFGWAGRMKLSKCFNLYLKALEKLPSDWSLLMARWWRHWIIWYRLFTRNPKFFRNWWGLPLSFVFSHY